ncbi:hypothetical protein F5Y04DRAFT_166361 [Hypomontagnella monticulosa]|nr:hypothetical protein F5Y04DRAFT_166361 [Hypomontagnella monticulosa]
MESTLEKLKSPAIREPSGDDYSWKKSSDLTDRDGLLSQETSSPKGAKPFWRRHIWAICCHIMLLTLYLTSIASLAARNSALRMKLLRTSYFSPATEAIEWVMAPWPAGDGLSEPFVGYPRPELEKAWEGLLKNMNIRISKEDVRHFGREETAVALPDGSGYIGTLNVFHEIHCVRWLHKHLYQEIYWPGLDDVQREKNRVHSEHCLSTLRKFALCHGDIGLITYSWNPHHEKPSANGTDHQCIDWESFSKWTEERAVDMFKPGWLVHPTLGPAYPNGEPLHGAAHDEIHTLPPVPPARP